MELIRTEDISNYCRQTTANESLKAKILADVDSFIVRKNLGAKFYTELVADCDSNDYSYTSMHLSWREQTIMMSVVT